jgi:hypothetical protein
MPASRSEIQTGSGRKAWRRATAGVVATMLAAVLAPRARAQERLWGKDLPTRPRSSSPGKRAFRPLTGPRFQPTTQSANRFEVPTVDGGVSSWMTGWGLNDDGSQNPVSSWGYNTAATTPLDPSKPMFELTFETNYFNTLGAHQAETYIQLIDTAGNLRRPFQAEIPLEGPSQAQTIMFTSTNFFSFLDVTSSRQRVKINDLFALARNVPLIFSDTDDCAGCRLQAGIETTGPGELAVISDLSHRLGDLRVSAFRARTLSGDGSALTGLNASNIVGGTLDDRVLSSSVALLGRSTTFKATQHFAAGDVVGQTALTIQGTTANVFPNLMFINTNAPIRHDWTLLSRGDNGSFLIADGPTDSAKGKLAIDSAGDVWIAQDVVVEGRVRVAEGEDKTVGQVSLVNGSATVVTKRVGSGSRIFLTHAGVVGQPGTLYVGTIVGGTSFDVRSTSPTDNSPVNYWIIN